MYRTDKQFMTNPATAGSRIYIGGLAKTIVAADLEEKFKMHGKILGLVLQMGFAFIQYETASQAQAAIMNENNAMLHGRKICVRQALDKSQKIGNNPNKPMQNRRPGPPQQHYNEPHMPPQQQFHPQQQYNHPPQNQQPPSHQNQPPHQNQSPQQFKKPPEEVQKPPPRQEPEKDAQEQEQPSVPPNGPPQNAPPPNNGPPISQEEPPKNDGPPDKRARKRRMRSRDRFPPGGGYRDDGGYYPPVPANYGNRPPPVIDQPDRNDCEIIVVSKLLTYFSLKQF